MQCNNSVTPYFAGSDNKPKMKKSNLIMTCVSITAITFLMNCNSPTKKVEKAEERLEDANKDLQIANEEYLEEIETYRLQAAARFTDNEKNIDEFNQRIEAKKKDVTEAYKIKVAELNKKNSDLKKKIADYKSTSKENWESFKTEFNHDLDQLGEALKDFTVKNKK